MLLMVHMQQAVVQHMEMVRIAISVTMAGNYFSFESKSTFDAC